METKEIKGTYAINIFMSKYKCDDCNWCYYCKGNNALLLMKYIANKLLKKVKIITDINNFIEIKFFACLVKKEKK